MQRYLVSRPLIALVVLVSFGIASIPAFNWASEHQVSEIRTASVTPVRAVEIGKGSQRGLWSGSFEWTLTSATEVIDCGSVLAPNEPPIQQRVNEISEVQGITFEDVPLIEPEVTSYLTATAQSHAETTAGDQSASIQKAIQSCADDLPWRRWGFFFATPIGWLIIIAAIGAVLGMMYGGGGGGGWRGRLSPNLSGSWTLRLWRG
ncbi:hypothetical protein GCM10010210_17780 [Pseudonocardia hydrocarbonoxydans]|uniref:Uncharacterized protein n=1 Tax=Pseudonocardia hydrocarbonoxydans TaxID=76726 RepID=A0A4Y3WLD5_9PSEU|nr:hypothetical protein PHY01_09920 [Pseudonocardia hydrocarbonoxydans]